MKKSVLIVLAFVFALSLAACGMDEDFSQNENPTEEVTENLQQSEEISEPEQEEPHETKTLPKIGGEPLTEEEVEFFNEMINPITDSKGNMEQNPWGHFFQSYFDDVREIDFRMFIWYFQSDGSRVDEEEFQKLREVEAWKFDNCETLEDMPVPVHSISKKEVDAVLTEYAGITSDDLDTSEVAYLEEYDCYYTSTSDWSWGMFICSDGERVGNTIYLCGESILSFYDNSEKDTDMLVLIEEEGSYKIVSHQHFEN